MFAMVKGTCLLIFPTDDAEEKDISGEEEA